MHPPDTPPLGERLKDAVAEELNALLVRSYGPSARFTPLEQHSETVRDGLLREADGILQRVLRVLGEATSDELLDAAIDHILATCGSVALGRDNLRAAAPLLVAPYIAECEKTTVELERAVGLLLRAEKMLADMEGALNLAGKKNAALREDLDRERELATSLQRSVTYETERAQRHMAEIEQLRQRLAEVHEALADLVDGEECEFRGRYCMTHGEKASPGECPNQLGRAVLSCAAASDQTEGGTDVS